MAKVRLGAFARDWRALFNEGSIGALDDRELLDRFLSGSDDGDDRAQAAFGVLVERHGRMVLSVCEGILGNVQDAEDAFQATFLVLARKAGKIHRRDDLGPWLFGTARRVALKAGIKLAERRARELRTAIVAAEIKANESTRDPNELDRAAELIAEIDRLPQKYRDTIILRYFDGLTHEQTAARLGIPVGTIRSRLSRGRERLKNRLIGREGFESRSPCFALAAGKSIFVQGTILSSRLVESAVNCAIGREAPTTIVALAASVLRASVSSHVHAVAPIKLAAIFKLAVISVIAAAVVSMNAAISEFGRARVAARTDEPDAVKFPRANNPKAIEQDKNTKFLEIKAIEAKTGSPIPEASIVCLDGDRSLISTDRRGIARIPAKTIVDLIHKKSHRINESYVCRVRIQKAGFTPLELSVEDELMKAGEIEPLTVELDPADSIGGFVRDENGAAIAGAKVRFAYRRASFRKRFYWETIKLDLDGDPLVTDAEGKFHAKILPREMTDEMGLIVNVEHPDFVSYQVRNHVPRPSIKSLREGTSILTMIRGTRLSGRVVDSRGEPVSLANVGLIAPGYAVFDVQTLSDKEGEFVVPQARAGKQEIVVWKSGLAPYRIDINVSDDLKPIEIRLNEGRLIRGRVVDSSGRPRDKAIIKMDYNNIFNRQTETDADGRFKWEHAPLERFDLMIGDPDRYESTVLTVEPEKNVFLVRLKPSLVVSGRVIDAESGRPIERFRAIEGFEIGKSGDGRPSTIWKWKTAIEERNGRFLIDTFNYPSFSPIFVRVEADGYDDSMAGPYHIGEGNQTFTFRLRRSKKIEGFVKDDRGRPVGGAEIVVASPARRVRFRDGRIENDEIVRSTRSRGDGRFSLAPAEKPFTIVVVHDDGIAITPQEYIDKKEIIDIMLRPWARIDGTLKLGGVPRPDERIYAYKCDEILHRDPLTDFIFEVETDREGRFAIDRVPPGEVYVCRNVGSKELRIESHPIRVEAEPGKTSRVTIGGSGLRVSGGLEPSKNIEPKFADARIKGSLSAVVPDPFPKDFPEWPADKKIQWWTDYNRTPEGKAYRRRRASYALNFENDRRFHCDDVPAGTYRLVITYERSTSNAKGEIGAKIIGSVNKTVVIGRIGDSNAISAIDLGSIPLDFKNQRLLSVGDAAPDFRVKSLTGESIELKAYRGKYVLLDFWATWCGPCVEQIEDLKKIHKKYGKDPRFVMIGLSLDDSIDKPARLVKNRAIDWTQGFLGDAGESKVAIDYAIRSIPSIWLIGPDGSIINNQLNSEAAVSIEIEKALGIR